MARQITVQFNADTRRLERILLKVELKAELRLTRSKWRRLRLRFALWRIERSLAR